MFFKLVMKCPTRNYGDSIFVIVSSDKHPFYAKGAVWMATDDSPANFFEVDPCPVRVCIDANFWRAHAPAPARSYFPRPGNGKTVAANSFAK